MPTCHICSSPPPRACTLRERVRGSWSGLHASERCLGLILGYSCRKERYRERGGSLHHVNTVLKVLESHGLLVNVASISEPCCLMNNWLHWVGCWWHVLFSVNWTVGRACYCKCTDPTLTHHCMAATACFHTVKGHDDEQFYEGYWRSALFV